MFKRIAQATHNPMNYPDKDEVPSGSTIQQTFQDFSLKQRVAVTMAKFLTQMGGHNWESFAEIVCSQQSEAQGTRLL